MTTSKKLHIKTYGCQMNSYDSDQMANVMKPFGYEAQSEIEGADLIILNTCHIREKATEKLYSELGRIKIQKDIKSQSGQQMLIAVAGCVGQAEGREIINRAPYVDIVMGPQSYHRLPEMVTQSIRKSGGVVDIEFPPESKFDSLPTPSVSGASSFLTIQEGCDKFCTFCVVPYTRGAEYSRPMEDILREARHFAQNGVMEVTLLGQNVNAYHGITGSGDTANLGKLIYAIAEIPEIKRIRYVTSHPRDMHEDLYRAHAELDKLMPYLHLPIQSGSNNVLERMNRKHTRDDYLRIIERLRLLRPDMVFSSDFIVGFPGETDKDFEDTLDIINQVNFAAASYSFKYSPRPGTPGALMDNQVPEEVMTERLKRLQALLDSQVNNFNKQSLGKTMPVLFDGRGRKPGQLVGKSPYMQSVHIEMGSECFNMIEMVEITQAHSYSLGGKLLETTLEPLEKVA